MEGVEKFGGPCGVEPTARWLRVAKRQWVETLNIAKVSPLIVENHEDPGFLVITLLLPGLVFCDDFDHNLAQQCEVNPSVERCLVEQTQQAQ